MVDFFSTLVCSMFDIVKITIQPKVSLLYKIRTWFAMFFFGDIIQDKQFEVIEADGKMIELIARDRAILKRTKRRFMRECPLKLRNLLSPFNTNGGKLHG